MSSNVQESITVFPVWLETAPKTLLGGGVVSLQLRDLDEVTRGYMLEELERDIESNNLYISDRLSERGKIDYPNLLRQAIENGNDATLATQLRLHGRLRTREPRTIRGKTSMVKVPANAPEVLAEGEFNRFYVRGLCRRVLAAGEGILIAYRARQSMNPRPESLAIEGRRFAAEQLLQDLRDSVGVGTALGLPPGPNSGMSAFIA